LVFGIDGPVDEGLAAAAAVERRSEHPIARAVVEAARAHGVDAAAADDVRALPGLGAEGRWCGRPVTVGNVRLFEARNLLTDDVRRVVAECVTAGAAPVVVAIDGAVRLVVGISDSIRPAAGVVVQRLLDNGIAHVAMLSGDSPEIARAVGAGVGVSDVRAGLLPADKVAEVARLRSEHGAVAMVGDGVNDAPALASADVGIVMGAIGSAAALEVADIALMSDDLQKIPYAVRLSRATLSNIRANMAISVGLKVAVLALAVAGISTLWMAVLADTGASILVVANAMRLLRHQ
jgi:Cd2+/Zn2+-exporting ATPase